MGSFTVGPIEDWSGSTNPTQRWYPTLTTLGDGNILFTDGAVTNSTGRPNVPVIFKSTLTTPFVFSGWEPLESAEYGTATYSWDMPYYPFMFLLSDGRLFMGGGHYFDPGQAGGLTTRRLDVGLESWTDIADAPIKGGSAVMYGKDLIMKAGGGLSGSQGISCEDNPVSSAAYSIDMASATPAWTALPSMAHRRLHFYLIALPDGTVLAVGGTQGDGPGGTLPPVCDPANDRLEPEIYSPYTNTWSPMASMATPRLYHSSAVLLRDGSVFAAGGQRDYNNTTTRYRNYEVFKPPYFFRATRPTITTCPASAQYNKGFDLETPDAANITKVRLIRTGAATHSFDHNQRMLELEFSLKSAGVLRVKAPQHGDLAPPGYYLLFICAGTNGQNPSEGTFVKLFQGGIGPGSGP